MVDEKRIFRNDKSKVQRNNPKRIILMCQCSSNGKNDMQKMAIKIVQTMNYPDPEVRGVKPQYNKCNLLSI